MARTDLLNCPPGSLGSTARFPRERSGGRKKKRWRKMCTFWMSAIIYSHCIMGLLGGHVHSKDATFIFYFVRPFVSTVQHIKCVPTCRIYIDKMVSSKCSTPFNKCDYGHTAGLCTPFTHKLCYTLRALFIELLKVTIFLIFYNQKYSNSYGESTKEHLKATKDIPHWLVPLQCLEMC